MDYNYEQSSEIEALDSIYFGDMKILETEPFHRFTIPIKSERYDEGEGMACNLVFTYIEKYPDEIPIIEVEGEDNFEEITPEELVQHLTDQAKENVGMVMIFTLVSAGQEYLNEKWDQMTQEKEEKKLAKLKAEEEAEQKRFEGTRVSVDTFLTWRKQFEIEMGIAAKREKDLRDKSKLTGKELFIRDTTLNESDLKFLDEGDAVKVDESLFQDMDDLDISDEDDEDYVPGKSDSDISAGQEYLNEKWDQMTQEKEEKKLAKLKAEEEAEQKRFEGTRVSVDTFLTWRKQFEIEMGIAAKREKDLRDKSKLTGKELFIRDTTLNESDLKFLDEGDAVKVDESLFQDMDDLDISDEDDEDYVPGKSDSDSN